MSNEKIPVFMGNLRNHMIEIPPEVNKASGIRVFGKLIKSLVFSTDVAIIRNINADAVIAVYPFTPQPAITNAVMAVAEMPVFCGVGGGITGGIRVVNLAQHAEFQGATGVVVNAPTPDETIRMLKETIDIPIVVTVVSEHTDFSGRLEAGADIFNVSGAGKNGRHRPLHPRELPPCSHHRDRRRHKRVHPRNHRGGRECRDVYAAHACGAFPGDHG